MKRNLFLGLLVAGLLIYSAQNTMAAGTVLDEIMAAGVIKVSTDANYAPQSFLNEKGELEGFDISVATEIAKRLGVKVEFITPDWDLITAGKWGKRWDMSVGSMTPTKERKNALLFTMPYYSSPAQFAIHKDNTTIKTIDDLKDKRIGVASETTNERFLQQDLDIQDTKITYLSWKPSHDNLKTYPTDANQIEDLALGDGARLDAVFTSRQTLAQSIKADAAPVAPLKCWVNPHIMSP